MYASVHSPVDRLIMPSVWHHPPPSLAPAPPPTNYAAFEGQPKVVIQGLFAGLVQDVHVPDRVGLSLESRNLLIYAHTPGGLP